MASVHLQSGKPNWFCHFTSQDGVRRSWSTGTPNKKTAKAICAAWEEAAGEARVRELEPAATEKIIEEGIASLGALTAKPPQPKGALAATRANKESSKKRKTLKDVARAARLSITTVSLALRNQSRIPPATRSRVKAIAREMGYRPDPALSALVAYRRGQRFSGNEEVLAWINVWPEPRKLHDAFEGYWKGAVERCAELGYKLEEFRLIDYAMKAKRLSQVLRARSIQGIFIPPQFHNRAHLNLEWEHFSSVAFGFTLARPRLHVVTNAQFRSTVIAMRSLRRLGHRRIGLALHQYLDERTDHNYLGGYLSDCQRVPACGRIPVFSVLNNDAPEARKLVAWFERYRPEAILTSGWWVEQRLQEAGYKAKRDYSLAMLAVRDSREGGIDQNEHVTGRVAVDFLVGMLHRGEQGIPKIPLRTLIEGQWVEGQTVRRLVEKPS